MKARISSIVFDKRQRPLRATILTSTGTVKVEWKNVAGSWCWFSSGKGDAKRAAVPVIERIERMAQTP